MPKTNICAFKDCDFSKVKDAGLSFFRFPTANAENLLEWLRVCDNDELRKLSEKQLQEKRVCSRHFLDCDIIHNGFRKLLKPNTIPQSSLSNRSKTCQTTDIGSILAQSPCNSTSHVIVNQHDIINTSLFSETNIEALDSGINSSSLPQKHLNLHARSQIKKRKKTAPALAVKQINEKLASKVKNLQRQLQRLKKRKLKLSINEIIEQITPYLNKGLLTFLKMQLNHNKQRKWEEDEKQFALGLYYKSPKAYLFLKDHKEFRLPAVSLIRNWVNVLNLKSGKNQELLKQLQIKLENKSDFEKECVLMWDEMSIRQGLDYNLKEDYIEGFHDLSDDFGGRSLKLAKSVLVFMLSGLTYDWKQPLMYFPTEGPVSGQILQNIIRDVIKVSEEVGFKIRHMVCDQGATNQKAISLLKITKTEPFIEYNNRKITFAFDVPHIIKCLRNNLIKHNYKMGLELVSWRDICELRELERTKPCKAAPKLTDRHLDPNNFDKMNVSLAAQIFSNSVYSALMAGASSGDLKSSTVVGTANFVKNINDAFDCLNSRYQYDANPLKRGLSDKNTIIESTLKQFSNYIDKWSIEGCNNPHCFQNFALSVNGILLLWDELKKEDKPYLLTSRLNQDKLENFFGVLRSRSGHNADPTAMQFRRNLQYAIMITLLVPPVGTNCEPDHARLLISDFQNNKDDSTVTATNEIMDKNIEDWFFCNDILDLEASENQACKDEVEQVVNLQLCTKTYIAGYLAFKLCSKFNCVQCEKNLIDNVTELNSTADLLLLWKAYPPLKGKPCGGLKAPTNSFFLLVCTCYDIFESEFARIAHSECIGNYLFKLISTCIARKHPEVFTDTCSEHRDYVIKLFIKTHIFYHIKWMSKDNRDKKSNKRVNLQEGKPNKKLLKLTS